VIVFSRDIIFVGELTKAAEAASVSLTERCVERRGDGRTGVCVDHHPWKTKDVEARLQELEQSLATIKKEQGSWTQEQYEAACAEWGGKLSETWERMVRVEVVNPVWIRVLPRSGRRAFDCSQRSPIRAWFQRVKSYRK
jgi:hypothetical protein